jgi:hypothetical protein
LPISTVYPVSRDGRDVSPCTTRVQTHAPFFVMRDCAIKFHKDASVRCQIPEDVSVQRQIPEDVSVHRQIPENYKLW